MAVQNDQLIEIAGSENIIDSPEILEAYARDQSFAAPRKPKLLVKPRDADDVQKIVRWANRTHTPLIPVSSGPPHFRGDTVPSAEGALIVDLSFMKEIIRIDNRNNIIMIEPGVTFEQLQPELARQGLKLSTPLLPRRNKSVIGSLLEREPILIPRYQWTLLDPLRCLEVIWGNGDKIRTGEAGEHGALEEQWKSNLVQLSPVGPGQIDYYRLLAGAQGSLGIVTWATVKCEILPRLHKLFFLVSDKLEGLIEPAYLLLKYRYGDEFLLLNSLNLASILKEDPDEIKALSEELPPWVLILGIAGRERLPAERVAYQEKDIREMSGRFGLTPVSQIAAIESEEVLETLLGPSREPYWKLRYKGGCHDVFFMTTLDNTPKFTDIMRSAARGGGYSPQDIGVYIQPTMSGVSCHCEFNLPSDPDNQDEESRTREVFARGSEALLHEGAFFSRPYGMWADMAYGRDEMSADVLRKVKSIFDPNNIMNPGKLCF